MDEIVLKLPCNIIMKIEHGRFCFHSFDKQKEGREYILSAVCGVGIMPIPQLKKLSSER